MRASSPSSLFGPAAAAALVPLNVAALNATQLTDLLAEPPAHLLVDCRGQPALHPLGVCRFVAQLLQLRSRGISIWLCNVHPVLRRCLYHVKLGPLFHVGG